MSVICNPLSSEAACTDCGGSDFFYITGDITCRGCGLVAQERTLVYDRVCCDAPPEELRTVDRWEDPKHGMAKRAIERLGIQRDIDHFTATISTAERMRAEHGIHEWKMALGCAMYSQRKSFPDRVTLEKILEACELGRAPFWKTYKLVMKTGAAQMCPDASTKVVALKVIINQANLPEQQEKWRRSAIKLLTCVPEDFLLQTRKEKLAAGLLYLASRTIVPPPNTASLSRDLKVVSYMDIVPNLKEFWSLGRKSSEPSPASAPRPTSLPSPPPCRPPAPCPSTSSFLC
jgi:hypothetical protein